MRLGIVGLPNVGKSTLFNALTGAGAASANYPFCTIDPNIGVVTVPDERLSALADMYHPEKVTPAIVEFVDIAGLVKGASKGEGLGNQFLSHVRSVDAIVHVVRCFESDEIIHVDGAIGAKKDIEVINLELIFSDLDLLNRRIDRVLKQLKGDRALVQEHELLLRLKDHLEGGQNARIFPMTPEERALLEDLPLLSQKPIIYAANLSEADFLGGVEENAQFGVVSQIAKAEGSAVMPICAKMEEELSGMDPADKALFLEELGLSQSGLDRMIKECYSLLGLISYLTAGKPEVRAWTIERGTKAPQAAGKIHSDFERGFIRAEVIQFSDLIATGGIPAAKEKGLVRSEGKDYVMQDGDVVLFRFNV